MARRSKAIWRREPWWERWSRRPRALALGGVLGGAALGLALVATGIVGPGYSLVRRSDVSTPPPRVATAPRAPAPTRSDRPFIPTPWESEPEPERSTAPRRSAIGFCQGRSGDNCVIDGDTFILDGETIRLAGIDAPEMGNPGCAEEAALAEAAESRLHELLNEGSIALVPAGDRDQDRYGRSLRDARVNGRSVSDTLISEGLARPWRGRKENWC